MKAVGAAGAAVELESRVQKAAASPARQLEPDSEQLPLELKAPELRLENQLPLMLPASATRPAADLQAGCLNRQV